MIDFNTQELCDLHESDPEEFERVAQDMIAKAVNSTPDKHRQKLIRIQGKFNRGLHGIKNPQARVNKFAEIFWETYRDVLEEGVTRLEEIKNVR